MSKYTGPKERLDAARSATSTAVLAELATSDYDFVKAAVAANPYTSAETLAALVPESIESWNAQEICLGIAGNANATPETLAALANKLIPSLNNGRNNTMAFSAGVALCCNMNAPIEVLKRVLDPAATSPVFRRAVAKQGTRSDALAILATDRSAKVRKWATQALERGETVTGAFRSLYHE